MLGTLAEGASGLQPRGTAFYVSRETNLCRESKEPRRDAAPLARHWEEEEVCQGPQRELSPQVTQAGLDPLSPPFLRLGPLCVLSVQRLAASFQALAGADPRQGRGSRRSAGTPHICAPRPQASSGPSRRRSLRWAHGGVPSRPNQELKGVGKGTVRAFFPSQPSNGPSFSIQKARNVPPSSISFEKPVAGWCKCDFR